MTKHFDNSDSRLNVDDDVITQKLTDAMTAGFETEFDPDEADRAGAFEEDALSESDALDSCIDLDEED